MAGKIQTGEKENLYPPQTKNKTTDKPITSLPWHFKVSIDKSANSIQWNRILLIPQTSKGTDNNDRGQGTYCGFIMVKGLSILISPFGMTLLCLNHCHCIFVGSLRKVSLHKDL